jgi:hypothetical protein
MPDNPPDDIRYPVSVAMVIQDGQIVHKAS